MNVKELINLLHGMPHDSEVIIERSQGYYEPLWSDPSTVIADGYNPEGYGYNDCCFREPHLGLVEYNDETEMFDDPEEVTEEWGEYLSSPMVVVL